MNAISHPPKHGFRLSVLDGVVLLLAAVLTYWLRSESFSLWWLVPMVLGHFFLFCNVFLVWQRWELLWAFVFVVNTAYHLLIDEIDGVSIMLWQLPMTVGVIARQLCSPWYHGIFAERWNPRLFEYYPIAKSAEGQNMAALKESSHQGQSVVPYESKRPTDH